MGYNKFVRNHAGNEIQKKFISKLAFDHELYIYELTRGTGLTPRLLGSSNMNIQLEFISGSVLKDISIAETVFNQLTQWYIAIEDLIFVKTGQYICLEDGNYANFLFTNNQIIGIDFEKWHYSTLETAFAIPLAFIRCMSCPRVDIKKIVFENMRLNFCSYGADPEKLSIAVDSACEKLLIWREIKKKIQNTSIIVPLDDENPLVYENRIYEVNIFDHIIYWICSKSKVVPNHGMIFLSDGYNIEELRKILSCCNTEYVLLMPPCQSSYTYESFVKIFSNLYEYRLNPNSIKNEDLKIMSPVFSSKKEFLLRLGYKNSTDLNWFQI